jgi:DNA polymerase elongation subunit (family B)
MSSTSGSSRLYLLHAGYDRNPAHADYSAKSDRYARTARSSEPARRLISLVCKTLDGDTKVLTVKDWLPWVYVKDMTDSYSDNRELDSHLKSASVSSVEFVKRVQAVGFTNERQDDYAKVRVRKWPVWCSDAGFKSRIFEHTVKPAAKFYCESGLRSGAWFDCAAITKDDTCVLADLTPQLHDATPPKLTVMAYDLETSGLDPNKCQIYQCCCVFWTSDQPVAPDSRSVVICTQATAVVGETRLEIVSSEKELLLHLARLILKHDVDILTGYNLSFDNGFIKRRLLQYTGMQIYEEISRPKEAPSQFLIKEMNTAALGANELVLWAIPGRVVIDLFMFAKANHPTLPNYKLDTCGEHFIGVGKDEMVFGTILQSFADVAAVELRGEVAKYCLQDGFLCLQLMHKWCAHISCTEVSIARILIVLTQQCIDHRLCVVVSLLLVRAHIYYQK